MPTTPKHVVPLGSLTHKGKKYSSVNIGYDSTGKLFCQTTPKDTELEATVLDYFKRQSLNAVNYEALKRYLK